MKSYISYMLSPATGIWQVPDFLALSAEYPERTELERRVLARREAAIAQAKKENNITTETDRLNLKVEAAKEKARKEVANRQLYEVEQQLILSQSRPLTGRSLSASEEFVGYGVPGYSTLMFADDASKHAALVGSALRNDQYGSALGNAIKVPADIAMGTVSLIPFADNLTNTAKNFTNTVRNLSSSLKGADGRVFNSKIIYNPNNYYRGVGKSAIEDAKASGVIRSSQTGRNINGPSFGRGHEAWNEGYIIEGTPESATWRDGLTHPYQKPAEGRIFPKESEPIEFINSGRTNKTGYLENLDAYPDGLSRYEAYPEVGGSVQNTPTSNFIYWKKYPIIGWRLKSFSQGEILNYLNYFK